MPTIRKLSEQEISERKQGKLSDRARVAREYDAMLADFDIGDWGELQLGPDEKKLTIRNRLIAAAGRKQLGVSFQRTVGLMVRFEMTPPDLGDAASEDDAEDEEAVDHSISSSPLEGAEPKRRGRRRKVDSVAP